ncbi:MAG: membrane protein insertion efficiency factor YidD [Pseudomonadota bacterium]
MARILLLLIRCYQLVLSPWIGSQCRFFPTCSCYAHEAINTHGAARGSLLTVMRLSKCHPWHAGGVDLVPPASEDLL